MSHVELVPVHPISKALSARVFRAAPSGEVVNLMRAVVLRGQCVSWDAGLRSAAELEEAAARYDRAAALFSAPVLSAECAAAAEECRSDALGL